MEREETLRLEAYLKEKLHPGLRLLARQKADDSVEVYLGAEFIAVVYKDEDEGEEHDAALDEVGQADGHKAAAPKRDLRVCTRSWAKALSERRPLCKRLDATCRGD